MKALSVLRRITIAAAPRFARLVRADVAVNGRAADIGQLSSWASVLFDACFVARRFVDRRVVVPSSKREAQPWIRSQRDSECRPKRLTGPLNVAHVAKTDASISGVSFFVFVFWRLGW